METNDDEAEPFDETPATSIVVYDPEDGSGEVSDGEDGNAAGIAAVHEPSASVSHASDTSATAAAKPARSTPASAPQSAGHVMGTPTRGQEGGVIVPSTSTSVGQHFDVRQYQILLDIGSKVDRLLDDARENRSSRHGRSRRR